MATLDQVIAAVRRNLRDQSSIAEDQIIDAINDAIEFYEPERLWFQYEAIDITLISNDPVVPNLPTYYNYDDRDSISLTVNGYNYDLDKLSPAQFDSISNAGASIPQGYAWIDDQLKLAPTPADSYTLHLRHFVESPAITAGGSTNVFLTHAKKMVECKATSYLWIDNQGSNENKSVYEDTAAKEFRQHRKTTNRKRARGQTRFRAATMPIFNHYRRI